MHRAWSAVAFVAAIALVFVVDALHVDYTGSAVLSITPRSEEERQWLDTLTQDSHFDVWETPRALTGPFIIRTQNKQEEVELRKQLDDKNIKYSFLIENLQSEIDKVTQRIAERKHVHKNAAGGFDLHNYHTLDEIVWYLNELAANYTTVTYTEIGTTYEGRQIPSVIISTGVPKPLIYFECTVHAREWLATSTCTYIINEMATKYGVDAEITQLLDTYDWQFTPVANPDGYVYTWETDRMWRKNRVPTYNESCTGVDVNRNFDEHFGGPGSSNDACNNEYHGPSAFSEKESQVTRDLMLQNKDRLQAVFTVHTYSQYWMMPYAYTVELPPDYEEMNRIMQIGVKALQDTFGTPYENGTIANTIYYAAGATVDWVYTVAGAPYSYTLELRDTGSFVLPPDQIMPTALETWNGIRASCLAMKLMFSRGPWGDFLMKQETSGFILQYRKQWILPLRSFLLNHAVAMTQWYYGVRGSGRFPPIYSRVHNHVARGATGLAAIVRYVDICRPTCT